MSVPHWPAALPRPMRDDFQSQDQEARLPQQAEFGPMGFRRRYSSVACDVRLKVDLSRNEKAIFDRFFVETAQRGAVPFWMPDPTTEGWPLLTSDGSALLDHTGTPLLLAARWLCLFGQDLPVEQLVGIRFRKTFSIVVLP